MGYLGRRLLYTPYAMNQTAMPVANDGGLMPVIKHRAMK